MKHRVRSGCMVMAFGCIWAALFFANLHHTAAACAALLVASVSIMGTILI